MRDRFTRRASIAAIALLALTALAVPTVAGAHVSAGDVRGDHRPSAWAPASELGDSGKAPSLTTDAEQLEAGAGSQLWLGYALLGGGLLALAFGLAAGARKATRGDGSARKARHRLGETGEHPRASLAEAHAVTKTKPAQPQAPLRALL